VYDLILQVFMDFLIVPTVLAGKCLSSYSCSNLILQVITVDFLIVPTVLTGGGLFTLIVSMFGFAALGRYAL
jgi:hypothetical protein